MGREDEIKLIAYSIWEEEGCCHGRDVEHWLKAEVIWEEKQKKGCPNCGSTDLWEVVSKPPKFVCKKCGHEFAWFPPSSRLKPAD